ncbi:hypothetical protein ABBQ32_001551 [Trebouxia sp. C0010 RCD-2024]
MDREWCRGVKAWSRHPDGFQMIIQQVQNRAPDFVKQLACTNHCQTVRSKLNTACSAKTLAHAGKWQRRHCSTSAASEGKAQVAGIEFTSTVTEREPSAQEQGLQYHDQALYNLPIMPLSKVKLPQETISLQLFEPRYRLLFKLVKQSNSRRFGLVLADRQQGMMESIGCLCELTHYIPAPERRRILIVARAIGRFEIKQVINDKPFVTAMVQDLADVTPETFQQAADISNTAMQLWLCMQQVKDLAGKLYSHAGPISDQIYSTEVQRWCPDRDCFAGTQDQLPTGQADVFEVLTKAGLLEAQDSASQLTEYFSAAGQSFEDLTEAQRHERFSFAVARTLDTTEEQLQKLLAMTMTAQRLISIHDVLADGRGYLAARSTLKDMF